MEKSNSIDLTYRVRPACPADAACIAALGAEVFTATYGHSVGLDDLQNYLASTYTLKMVQRDIGDAERTVLVVANSDGQCTVAGFAYVARKTSHPCLAHLHKKMELERLYVSPSVHGQGVGGLLADEAEAVAQREGLDCMWLGVWEHNSNAIRFYRKRGYATVGEHRFEIGQAPQRDLIMVKGWEATAGPDC